MLVAGSHSRIMGLGRGDDIEGQASDVNHTCPVRKKGNLTFVFERDRNGVVIGFYLSTCGRGASGSGGWGEGGFDLTETAGLGSGRSPNYNPAARTARGSACRNRRADFPPRSTRQENPTIDRPSPHPTPQTRPLPPGEAPASFD